MTRLKPVIEDFSGMTQLTDFAVYAMMMASKEAKCQGVLSVNMTGCSNITDVGLGWFASMCPNIQKVRPSVFLSDGIVLYLDLYLYFYGDI